jgi:hypothetical protein
MTGNIASLICAIITLGMGLISCTFTLIFIFIGISYLQRGNFLYIGLSSGVVKVIIIVNTLFLAYAIIGNGILTKSKKEKYLKHIKEGNGIVNFIYLSLSSIIITSFLLY